MHGAQNLSHFPARSLLKRSELPGKKAFVSGQEDAVLQARASLDKAAAQDILVEKTEETAEGQVLAQFFQFAPALQGVAPEEI